MGDATPSRSSSARSPATGARSPRCSRWSNRAATARASRSRCCTRAPATRGRSGSPARRARASRRSPISSSAGCAPTAPRSACSRSIRRARSAAARSSATACACRATPTDPGVFIRSMATRGHLGGLALATPQAVRVLDAVGKAWIVIETVGVGQVEVEIAGHADTTVVVVNPGWGDAVQTAKAGLMEIADVFVVNKADRPGAAETVSDLAGHARAVEPAHVAAADRADGRDDRRRRRRAVRRDRRAPRPPRGDRRRRRRGGAARLREELRGLVAAEMLERAADACARSAVRRRSSTRSRAALARSVHRRRRVACRREARIRCARCSTTRPSGSSRPPTGWSTSCPPPGGLADAIVGLHRALRARGRHRPGRGRGARSARRLLGTRCRRRRCSGSPSDSARRRRRSTRCSCRIGTGDGRAARGCTRSTVTIIRASNGRRATAATCACFVTDDDGAVLVVGRGICDRWEIGFEVDAGRAGAAGSGARSRAAAVGLVPAGKPLWAQVAPGNAASLRALTAAGFVPVGAGGAVPAPAWMSAL